MDLSQYTDEELMQMAGVGQAPDLSQISDEELMQIAGVQPKAKDFYQKVGGSILKRTNELADNIVEYKTGDINAAQLALRGVGKAGFGTLADVTGNAISSAYGQLPDAAQEKLGSAARYVAESPVGDAAKYVGGKWGQFAEQNPEAARDIESVANIAGYVPVSKVAGKVAQQATTVGQKAVKAANAFEDATTKMGGLAGETKSGVAMGKASLGLSEYLDNRVAGVSAKNADELNAVGKELHSVADPLYAEVDALGGRINAKGISRVFSGIDEKFGSKERILKGQTLSMYKDMQRDIATGDASVSKLNEYRKAFGEIAESNTKSVVDGGGLTPEGRKAVLVIKGIDDGLNKLDDSDFISGSPEVVDKLNKARAASARAFSYERIARKVKRADGDPARTKTALKRILDDEKTQGLMPDEIAALKKAADYSVAERLERGLGTFGFDLGSRKNVALPGVGGAAAIGVGGASAAIPVIAAGSVARQTSKLAARGKAQMALDKIASRSLPEGRPRAAKPMPPKPLALPAPQSTISVDKAGRAVQMTEAERAAMGQAPSQFMNPSIEQLRSMPPEEAKKLLDMYFNSVKQGKSPR
jgi:hypothetical protein